MPDRAVLFVDGNNWYHSLHGLGLTRLSRLDYAVISKKLTGPRAWIAPATTSARSTNEGTVASMQISVVSSPA